MRLISLYDGVKTLTYVKHQIDAPFFEVYMYVIKPILTGGNIDSFEWSAIVEKSWCTLLIR